jgi:hypothetical protein
MIFHSLEFEPIVQTHDKTRLSASKSFVSKGSAAIAVVEIEPENGAGFFNVTGTSSDDWFLDWQYASPGTKQITLRITTDGSPVSHNYSLHVENEASDGLWSKDQDLVSIEPDVLQYVRQGRNSFIDMHRAVQKKILDWVASIRITKNDGTRLEKDDFILTDELRQLSTYWVLWIIYSGLSNKPDDHFAQKASQYKSQVLDLKNINTIQPDLNGDAEITEADKVDMRSIRAVRD